MLKTLMRNNRPLPAIENHKQLSPVAAGIVRNLIYSDIFSYPLNVEEIVSRSDVPRVTELTIRQELNELVKKGLVHRLGTYYSTQKQNAWEQRRKVGNQGALKAMKLAKMMSGFISLFPFVRAVMISGSLSKDYMDSKSDLDFFLVTAPKRLWIVKALMVLTKKVIFLNSYRYFCVNYLISTDRLEIEEKNLYTATELATVIPTYGSDVYVEFRKANSWALEYYPNFPERLFAAEKPSKTSGFKSFCEWFLKSAIFDKLDSWLMKKFLARAERKFRSGMAKEHFGVAFKSKKYSSKYHKKNHQAKVMDRYHQAVKDFEYQNSVVL